MNKNQTSTTVGVFTDEHNISSIMLRTEGEVTVMHPRLAKSFALSILTLVDAIDDIEASDPNRQI